MQTEYRSLKINDDIFTEDEDTANWSSDEYSIVTSVGEDVFVTDITSGLVTVTIKESNTPEGFFKRRDGVSN